eukprot:6076326-Alexandrium_andersonii.AAC.1
MRIKDASSRARIVESQSMSEALENQGFNPKGVGSEVPKSARVQHAVQCVPSMRAPQLFFPCHAQRRRRVPRGRHGG